MAQTIHDIRRREHVHDNPDAKRLYPEDIGVDEIEEDIEYTRSAMDDTISELFERLAPKNLLSDVMGAIRESMRNKRRKSRRRRERAYDDDYGYDEHDDEPGIARRAATAVGKQTLEIVKNHPLPTALITAGIVWMAMEPDRETRAANRRIKRLQHELEPPVTGQYTATYRRIESDYGGETGMRGGAPQGPGMTEKLRQGAHDARERLGDAAHSMRERVGDAAHSMRERASHATEKIGDFAQSAKERVTHAGERLSDTASHLGENIREGIHHTRERYDRAVDQYPLAVAAGALGVGILAGMLLPRTRAEDRFIGETSDEVKERGRELGREAAERGTEMAEKALSSVAEEAGVKNNE